MLMGVEEATEICQKRNRRSLRNPVGDRHDDISDATEVIIRETETHVRNKS